jgi:hypothetical protein
LNLIFHCYSAKLLSIACDSVGETRLTESFGDYFAYTWETTDLSIALISILIPWKLEIHVA